MLSPHVKKCLASLAHPARITLLTKQHQGLVFMNFKSTGNTYSLMISALGAFVVNKKVKTHV